MGMTKMHRLMAALEQSLSAINDEIDSMAAVDSNSEIGRRLVKLKHNTNAVVAQYHCKMAQTGKYELEELSWASGLPFDLLQNAANNTSSNIVTITDKFKAVGFAWVKHEPRQLRILKVLAHAKKPLVNLSGISAGLHDMFGTRFNDMSLEYQLSQLVDQGYVKAENISGTVSDHDERSVYWSVEPGLGEYLRSVTMI